MHAEARQGAAVTVSQLNFPNQAKFGLHDIRDLDQDLAA
jgi:hypothetical protein